MVDWQLVARVATPVLTLFLGVWVNRRFESRPVLITHFGHVSSFNYTPPGGQAMVINTHTVVLRNVGRKAANNVRMHHNTLPSFNVWPHALYQVENLQGGSTDIVFPVIVPNQMMTVSYLYFAPTTVANVNAGIQSDEGFPQVINVLLQRQYPGWLTRTLSALCILGLIAAGYIVFAVAARLLQ